MNSSKPHLTKKSLFQNWFLKIQKKIAIIISFWHNRVSSCENELTSKMIKWNLFGPGLNMASPMCEGLTMQKPASKPSTETPASLCRDGNLVINQFVLKVDVTVRKILHFPTTHSSTESIFDDDTHTLDSGSCLKDETKVLMHAKPCEILYTNTPIQIIFRNWRGWTRSKNRGRIGYFLNLVVQLYLIGNISLKNICW